MTAASLQAQVDTLPDIIRRIDVMSDPMISMSSYSGPVWYQWMSDVSLSDVGVAYVDTDRDLDLDPQLGEGEDFWQFAASTYMKYKSSTLWGSAAYSNGHQRNVQYNESADIDLIYPYVTADTIGGDMAMERYSFAGGYADHHGGWSWGAELGYKAGLYYRDVDPRPRNVTGQFEVSVGAGRRLWHDYDLAVSLSLRRYTQNQDIMFKSEMGEDMIYHLTGLGHHYNRFAGQGFSAYYSGYRYGAIISLYPRSSRGLALGIEMSRFTFDKILTDMNALPLVSAWHNTLRAQASWLSPGTRHDWAVNAVFDAYRRHGSENIFGDASSNIYPQICALEMYADNHYGISVEALYAYHTQNYRLWVKPVFGYSHRREIYADPPTESLDERHYGGVELGSTVTSASWRAQATVSYRGIGHYGSMISPAVSLYHAISSSYALNIKCRYTYSQRLKSLQLSLGVNF